MEVLAFIPAELTPVLAALRPDGWVNLQPEVDADAELPAPSGVFAIFGARGPAVPFCTWHPGAGSVGIQHGTGPKVSRRIDLPVGWRVVQDHPKRGLVAQVAPGTTDEEALRWLIATATALCPLPMAGRWVAEIHP